MDIEIKIPHTPSVNITTVWEILTRRFPECDIKGPKHSLKRSLQGQYIVLKKSIFVEAFVLVQHKEQKGETIIGINGMMSTTGLIFFGLVFHYILRGSFLSDVANAIEEEIKKTIRYETLERKVL